jgi:uncharacterized protein (TIGR02271 family)
MFLDRRSIMENTVVGVYDSKSEAQSAMNELLASGFSHSDIQLNPDYSGSTAASDAPMATSSASSTGSTSGTGHGIGHFFRSLFGMDDTERSSDIYSEAVRRGSVVLVVNVDSDEQRDRAMEVMNRYNPVDVDERSTHWRNQGWSAYDASQPMLGEEEIRDDRATYSSARANETAIPVVQEELQIGKREVQRGGVRVHRRMTQTPVQENVQLRQEHVKVERHPVDQPATEADLAGFKEGSTEMRETAEEPIVEKTARVVEEVVIGKDVTQETANINDTVRRTDVEVEQLGGGADDASDFRRHWQNAYGSSGGRYEEYDSAYRYGSQLSGTERFRNYRWDEVEPDVRRDWESSHPGSTWDKVKDAVRYGVERVKGAGH